MPRQDALNEVTWELMPVYISPVQSVLTKMKSSTDNEARVFIWNSICTKITC